jgi:dipeptidyl aminopeptidase/acylaminoacyl peptidase
VQNIRALLIEDLERFKMIAKPKLRPRITPVLKGEYSIEEFTVKSGIVAYTRVNVDKPAELWVKEAYERQITHLNKDIMNDVQLQPAERFSFTQKDGTMVEGWILKPIDWDMARASKYQNLSYRQLRQLTRIQ